MACYCRHWFFPTHLVWCLHKGLCQPQRFWCRWFLLHWYVSKLPPFLGRRSEDRHTHLWLHVQLTHVSSDNFATFMLMVTSRVKAQTDRCMKKRGAHRRLLMPVRNHVWKWTCATLLAAMCGLQSDSTVFRTIISFLNASGVFKPFFPSRVQFWCLQPGQ